MTLSSFLGRAFSSCFASSKTLVGCDDYGADVWMIEREASTGVDEVVYTLARGCSTSSRVHLSVKLVKGGILREFGTTYDDLDERDAARAKRELREWLSRAPSPRESPSPNARPSTPQKSA